MNANNFCFETQVFKVETKEPETTDFIFCKVETSEKQVDEINRPEATPSKPAKRKPLTPAEKQRAYRRRKKKAQLIELAKLEGICLDFLSHSAAPKRTDHPLDPVLEEKRKRRLEQRRMYRLRKKLEKTSGIEVPSRQRTKSSRNPESTNKDSHNSHDLNNERIQQEIRPFELINIEKINVENSEENLTVSKDITDVHGIAENGLGVIKEEIDFDEVDPIKVEVSSTS